MFAIKAQAVAIRAIIDSISISFKIIGIIKHIEREINMISMISLTCLFMLFLMVYYLFFIKNKLSSYL